MRRFTWKHAFTAAFAVMAGNLIVATVTTTGTPDIQSVSKMAVSASPSGTPSVSPSANPTTSYGIVRPNTSPTDRTPPPIVDEAYLHANDAMFYPNYRAFRPDAVGCDTKVPGFRSNPLCQRISKEEQIARTAYADEFLGNPIYKCADGRNNGLDWRTLDKFRPCPTGALRLRLADGKLSLIHTTDRTQINIANGKNRKVKAAWYFMISEEEIGKNGVATGRGNRVYDTHSDKVTPFIVFVREDGGLWRTTNLDDRAWPVNGTYDFLVTFNVKGRTQPAWLPFDNECLPINEHSNSMSC